MSGETGRAGDGAGGTSGGADDAPDAAHTGRETRSARGGWRLWVVTLGGSGLLPFGPGTWGSLTTTLLFGAAWLALTRAGLAPAVAWNLIAAAGLIIFSALCVGLGPWTVRHFARKDPGPCVLDEAAGICLSSLFLPIYSQWRPVWALLAAFVAFRVFDITKPPPARQLEKLPLGWGILMDDLAAAVYANLVCQAVLRCV